MLIKDLTTMDDQQQILIALEKSISSMSTDLQHINATINEIKTCYVTKSEFIPVRTIAFGLVAFIAFAFLAAVVSLVMK